MRVCSALLIAAALATTASAAAGLTVPRNGLLVVATGSVGLYTIRSDGRDLRRLPVGRCSEPACDSTYHPSWSPDGRALAFSRRLSEIWRMSADGSNLRRLTAPARGEDWEPRLSRDGRRIAFVRLLPRAVRGHLGTIWVMSADGSRPRLRPAGSASHVRPS